MKKTFFIFVILFSITNLYANYTHTQSIFDDYNQSTDENFTYKNSTYRQDAKLKKYPNEYDISKSSDHNCEYTAAGQLSCWKYKIVKAKEKNAKISEKIISDYNGRKQTKDISSGDDFNCALDNGDEIFCWGSNKRGSLVQNRSKKLQKSL